MTKIIAVGNEVNLVLEFNGIKTYNPVKILELIKDKEQALVEYVGFKNEEPFIAHVSRLEFMPSYM